MQTRINREKTIICVIKSLELLKKLKNDQVSYLGLELAIHVINIQIHLVRQSLFFSECFFKNTLTFNLNRRRRENYV
jgi:hypothetical protein